MSNLEVAKIVLEAANTVLHVDTLSVRITYDPKTRKYSLNTQDISIFVNRFSQIC